MTEPINQQGSNQSLQRQIAELSRRVKALEEQLKAKTEQQIQLPLDRTSIQILRQALGL